MQILIVDDAHSNLKLLAEIIRTSGHEPILVQNGYEALDILETHKIQLILVDWMMPEMTGIELVQRIRSQFLERYIYIIMLTAKNTPNDVSTGLEIGADDYMVKPFVPRELRARINTGIRIIEMETRLAQSLEHMEHLATHDHLTHVFNRHHFQEVIREVLRKQEPAALFMIDVDHFKAINDTYGHLVGDHILMRVAEICKDHLEEDGVIARYGGEEFVGLLKNHDRGTAYQCLNNLRERIASEVFETKNQHLHVTVSIGLNYCLYVDNLETAIHMADEALYRAKQGGRNRVEITP